MRAHDSVRRYYEDKLERHGPTARGVDWSSDDSQRLRFDRLLSIVDTEAGFSLNDYGCGYGALALYLGDRDRDISYHGYDLSARMLEQARELNAGRPGVCFSGDPGELPVADYTVASGLFNVKLDAADDEWADWVVDTIARMAAVSRRGFAFNMVTAYVDPGRRREHLYHADPLFFFSHCRERYSRWVALLHDYGLYEFTLLVRRDERRDWPAATGGSAAGR